MSAATSNTPRRRIGAAGWPIGFAIAIVLIFIFYRYWLPDMVDSVQKFVGDWFPLATINQCLIWVTMALGLNIVVGYAGLLDLGYVAFWAIGGYTAGRLMLTFFFHPNTHLFGSVRG